MNKKVLGSASLYVVWIVCFLFCLLGLGTSLHVAADTNARYIDFDSGNDSNPGTRDAPWKHHPWDANAGEKSASARGIRTYIFRKGVTYRGTLTASASGTKDIPIRLTTEAGWGNGSAILSGSTAYAGGWNRCPEDVTRLLPQVSRSKAWCKSVKMADEPRLLWEVNGSVVTRIPIARTPNWTSGDPDDPRSGWYELGDVIIELAVQVGDGSDFRVGETLSVEPQRSASGSRPLLKVVGVEADQIQLEVTNWHKGLLQAGDTLTNGLSRSKIKEIGGTHSIIRHLVDRTNLAATDASGYKGATVWAERRSMPKADAAIVTAFDTERRSLQANFHRSAEDGPMPHDRYFMEGLPSFLGSAGEYVFLAAGERSGMLVVRLPGDRDPNNSIIEAATRSFVLKIQNQSHIEISNLGFRYTNQIPPGDARSRHAPMYASALQIRGDIKGININNCHFSWLAAGIVAFPEDRKSASIIDGVTITNSRFSDIDSTAIALGNGQGHYKLKKNGSRLIHVTVQNNRLKNIGYRTLAQFGIGSHGVGINIRGGEVVDVSGNQIDRSWGSGISVTLGSDFEQGQVVRPFLRGLIYDNQIIDTLLGAQDGGGINAWMGGPAYIYNNISGNPVGCMYSRYKTSTRKNWYRRGCYGVGIYLDGQYKGYMFNNIVWGKKNNANDQIYNSAGLNEAMGFMHTVFNNTIYRFSTGLHKGMHQHNRNYYLANLFIDMGLSYIDQEPRDDTIDYATLAYSRNQFYGEPSWFGKLGTRSSRTFKDLESWRNAMQRAKLMKYDTGSVITVNPVRDATAYDFRPVSDSPVIDRGVKVFVPWALYEVVGEWHFLRRNDQPAIVNGENINMNDEWVQRDMFDRIPRHNLRCVNTDITDFENGILEDWIPGSLRFDGETRYCTFSDAVSEERLPVARAENALSHVGNMQDSVDMDSNNFLIEAVIVSEAGSGPAGLVQKLGSKGYSLQINASGLIELVLNYGSHSSQRVSSLAVNDGHWHHILVEVNRSDHEGINIYIDGRLANGGWSGSPMKAASLSNMAEFIVGRSDTGFFKGKIDFLRLSRGTLAQAETNIEELYEWEFDGPYLYDFHGEIHNNIRDVGALEYVPD